MSESRKLRLKRKTERRKSQKSSKRLIKKKSKNESRTNLRELGLKESLARNKSNSKATTTTSALEHACHVFTALKVDEIQSKRRNWKDKSKKKRTRRKSPLAILIKFKNKRTSKIAVALLIFLK